MILAPAFKPGIGGATLRRGVTPDDLSRRSATDRNLPLVPAMNRRAKFSRRFATEGAKRPNFRLVATSVSEWSTAESNCTISRLHGF